MYYPGFTKAIFYHFLIQDKTLSWRNKIGMHTSKDDYLINTLRLVSAKESTQIYGKLLPETLTSPEMKESKAYKTYIGYASGVVPPKIAKKFMKASSSKKDSILVPADDETTMKGKHVKRSAKKSITTPAIGIVISEAPVETQSKRKEKVDIARGKGIELLSEVALAKKAQMKPHQVLKRSNLQSQGNDKDDNNDENDSENEGNDEENKSDDDKTPFDCEKGSDSEQDSGGSESVSESDRQEDEEEVKDDDEKEDEFAHTLPNTDDEEDANLELKNDYKIEGDEDRGMDDTTNQFNDDVDARLNEPTQTDEEVVQDKEADVEMTDAQEEKENLEITQEQVVEDAHVMISNVAKETEVSDATSGSSKGIKSQPKSSGKNVQSVVPEFEVADIDMPQDQGGNLGNDDEPRKESASKRDWFTKPTRPQEPIDPDWNIGKTPQKGPTQTWLMTLDASYSTDKSLKLFDELMSTPIDFSAYIMNGLKISNLTQETLLGLAFILLKGTRSNYAELEYDFKECYKALLEKLDLENPEGRNMLNGGISNWTTQHKTFYAYAQGLESTQDVYSTKRILAVTRFDVMKKHGYGYLREIKVQRADNVLYTFKEGDFPRLCLNHIEDMLILVAQNRLTNLSGDDVVDFAIALKMFTRSLSYQKKINVTRPDTVRPDLRKRHPYTPYQDPQGFIYVDRLERNRLMRSNELYKFNDGTLTRLITSLEDITNIIHMSQNRRDLPSDIPLDSIVVRRYDKRSKSKNKGKVPTEMELVLEQTQQGSSYKVSVSTEGVEELKRKVKIKGVKKEALLKLRKKSGQYICCQNHKDDC
nr:hypothetical protein [Tanacetum cinerariifolium]